VEIYPRTLQRPEIKNRKKRIRKERGGERETKVSVSTKKGTAGGGIKPYGGGSAGLNHSRGKARAAGKVSKGEIQGTFGERAHDTQNGGQQVFGERLVERDDGKGPVGRGGYVQRNWGRHCIKGDKGPEDRQPT